MSKAVILAVAGIGILGFGYLFLKMKESLVPNLVPNGQLPEQPGDTYYSPDDPAMTPPADDENLYAYIEEILFNTRHIQRHGVNVQGRQAPVNAYAMAAVDAVNIIARHIQEISPWTYLTTAQQRAIAEKFSQYYTALHDDNEVDHMTHTIWIAGYIIYAVKNL